MSRKFLFSSESVTNGHPDKICDLVSDSILDACLKQDPKSKVACETMTKTGLVMVFGEITTNAKIDYEDVIRTALKGTGFDDGKKGLDYKSCAVLVQIEKQSREIAASVHLNKEEEDLAAGDQGMMFGYATNETENLIPFSHQMALLLSKELENQRGKLPWIRPDGKTQVTVEYEEKNGVLSVIRVHTVLISIQHTPCVSHETIEKDIKEHVIKKIIPAKYLDEKTKYIINPSKMFVTGGPHGDAGLTGRKIIVDTYGGWGAHGGGAFSGKDPTKVDRSAAYAARWVAKSLVSSGICSRALVQVSYSIGISEPLSVFVETYGTSTKTQDELQNIVKNNFDLRPGSIIRDLKLYRPIYAKTSSGGHFGRNDPDFLWEVPKKLSL